MYSKVFKGAATAPAAAALPKLLPQLGDGISGTIMAGVGIVMIALVVSSTVVAKLHRK